MKLEEVIHHYLGCECLIDGWEHGRNEIGVLNRIDKGEGITVIIEDPILNKKGIGQRFSYELSNEELIHVKPILKNPSRITKTEMFDVTDTKEVAFHLHGDLIKSEAMATKWLLDNHFDLFGLIESGQAIERTDK